MLHIFSTATHLVLDADASDAGTQVHLIPAKKSCSSSIEASGVPKKVLCTQGGSRLKSDGTILNGAAVVPHPTEAVEIEVQSPAVENQLPESIALLGRGNCFISLLNWGIPHL